MKNIILDTNIILRRPKVLGLRTPDLRILVPLDVVQELNFRAFQRRQSFDKRIDLIEKASLEGTISIINTDLPLFTKYLDQVRISKLAGADVAITTLALQLLEAGHEVIIATQDKEISRFADQNGIQVLSEADIDLLLNDFVEPSNLNNSGGSIQTEIVSYEKSEKWKFIRGILLGVAMSAVANLTYNYIGLIIKTINIWGTIFAILLTGILLFIFREKNRLSYGVAEFFVGVAAIILLFQPASFDFSNIDVNLDFGIKLLGGLYIMVRGQDNIVKALRDTKVGLMLKDKYQIGI